MDVIPQVSPARQLPMWAKRAGAQLVIINSTPTPLDAEADLLINRFCGEVMAQVLAQLQLQKQ